MLRKSVFSSLLLKTAPSLADAPKVESLTICRHPQKSHHARKWQKVAGCRRRFKSLIIRCNSPDDHQAAEKGQRLREDSEPPPMLSATFARMGGNEPRVRQEFPLTLQRASCRTCGKAIKTVIGYDRNLSDFSHSRCLSATLCISVSRWGKIAHYQCAVIGRCGFWERNLQHKRGSSSLSVAEDFFPALHFCKRNALDVMPCNSILFSADANGINIRCPIRA